MFWLWRLKWRRYWSQRDFDKKLRNLRKKKASSGDVAELEHDKYYTLQDIENGIDYAVGTNLLDKARSLDVEMPGYADLGMWDSDNEEQIRWLSSKGRAQVRKAIDEEEARRFEVTTRWVTKLILPLAGGAVGIIGALIGLVAAFKK